MKVAFTGSSSTGKTTLAENLQKNARFCALLPRFITVDARSLLTEGGFRSMDRMSPEELREFQRKYLERKLLIEEGIDEYFTDRSFVDVAAYWLERDVVGLHPGEIRTFVECCRQKATKYDIHFYFPSGLFQFERDGYRSDSSDFHQRVDIRILQLLYEWECKVVRLDMVDITARCDKVIESIRLIRGEKKAGSAPEMRQ